MDAKFATCGKASLLVSCIIKSEVVNHKFQILFESIFMLGFVWFGVHILASGAERKALQTVSSLLTFNGQLKVF